jgi:hypothetical protein
MTFGAEERGVIAVLAAHGKESAAARIGGVLTCPTVWLPVVVGKSGIGTRPGRQVLVPIGEGQRFSDKLA